MPSGGARPGAGAPAVPTALKILRGNPGKRPLPANEPQPEAKLPPCPPHIQGEARHEWRRTGRKLLALGLVTEIDTAMLAVYCVAWGRWVEAENMVRETGLIIKTKGGELIASPMLRVAVEAMNQMTRAAAEFGMSPSSRTRVRAAETKRAESPWDKLL